MTIPETSFQGFANLTGLWGLLALPIILLLHMLRDRIAHYTVSSLTLWSFLESEVRGSQARRIPFSWVLLFQLLVALLLTAAWMQPQIVVQQTYQPAQHQILLLDVSTSMLANDVFPNRFEKAREALLMQIDSLGDEDVLTVITFADKAYWLGDSRETSRAVLRDRINQLHAGGTGAAFADAMALTHSTQIENLPTTLHIYTDGAFVEPTTLPDDANWILFGDDGNNQAVLDLSVNPVAAGEWQLFAKVGNFTNNATQQTIVVYADGKQINATPANLPPQSYVEKIWPITGEPELLTVSLVQKDAQPTDDTAHIGLRYQKSSIRVALIVADETIAENSPLLRALHALPGTSVTVLNVNSYLPSLTFDIVFFDGVLPADWPKGTVVVTNPPSANPLLPIADETIVSGIPIAIDDPLLANVDVADVGWTRVMSPNFSLSGWRSLITVSELPVLIQGRQDDTQLFVLLTPLSDGIFTRHPAFPILIARLTQSIGQATLPTQVQLNQPLSLLSFAPYERLVVTLPETAETDPFTFLNTELTSWVNTKVPGIYRFTVTDLEGTVTTHTVGVNSADNQESIIARQDWLPPLNTTSMSPVEMIVRPEERDVTPWLLLAAAIFLLLEAFVAWKS